MCCSGSGSDRRVGAAGDRQPPRPPAHLGTPGGGRRRDERTDGDQRDPGGADARGEHECEHTADHHECQTRALRCPHAEFTGTVFASVSLRG